MFDSSVKNNISRSKFVTHSSVDRKLPHGKRNEVVWERVNIGKITAQADLVSYAAVLCLVTQRSSPRGEERCVTRQRTAA